MEFKPSAGIFVGGLAASFGGAMLMMMAAAGTDTAFMALVGALVSIAGTIMLCVGAARALRIIDALPAAFRNLDQGRMQHPQFSTPQSSAVQLPDQPLQHG